MKKQDRLFKRAYRLYKRGCFDYDGMFSAESLLSSVQVCSHGVMWKDSTQSFKARRQLECARLHRELVEGSYRKIPAWHFKLNERGKRRDISAVSFRDRVVQRSLCDSSLVPVLGSSLIYDNYASLPGKGTALARSRFERFLRNSLASYADPYLLVFDWHDYFGTIPAHRVFKAIGAEYRRLELALLRQGILPQSENAVLHVGDFLSILSKFVLEEGEAMGLGNQTSQTVAIWWPNGLDQECSKLGHYGRYMDDGYCFCKDKATADKALQLVTEMSNELGLTLNTRKTHVLPVRRANMSFLKRVYRATGATKCADSRVKGPAAVGSNPLGIPRSTSYSVRAVSESVRWHAGNISKVLSQYDGVHVTYKTIEAVVAATRNVYGDYNIVYDTLMDRYGFLVKSAGIQYQL